MLSHTIPLIVAAMLILIGFCIKKKRIYEYNRRCEFTMDFNNRFFDMTNNMFITNHLNAQKYNSVIMDIDKIQQELGADGVISDFVDYLRGLKGRNYQLFMNIMPEIRSMMLDSNYILKERLDNLLGLCEDALKRHIGNLDREIELESKNLYNPITCLGEGIRWIIGLPFDILSWAGILSVYGNTKIKANILYRFVEKLVVFIGLVGSIFTIILGWDEFFSILIHVKWAKIK